MSALINHNVTLVQYRTLINKYLDGTDIWQGGGFYVGTL